MGRVSINSETARVVLDALESRYFYSDSDGEEYNDEEVISAAEMLRNDINQQWISVADRLPEYGDTIWGFDGDVPFLCEYHGTGGFESYGASCDREGLNSEKLLGVTHWMELQCPEPPESRQ